MRYLLFLLSVLAGCQSQTFTLPYLTADRRPTITETPRANNVVTSIAFADEVFVIGFLDDSIQLHRITDFKLLARQPGRDVNAIDEPGVGAVGISPSGDRIIVDHLDTGPWMYDRDLRPIVQLGELYKPRFLGIRWLRDGKSVIGFGHDQGRARIVRWDAVTGREIQRLAVDDWDMDWGPRVGMIELQNGQLVISAGNEVRAYTADLAQQLVRFKPATPDGSNAIVGVAAGAADWFHVIGRRESWTIQPATWAITGATPAPFIRPSGAVFFAPNGRDYALVDDFSPDLRPIRIVTGHLEFASVLETGEPINGPRNLLAVRWESPTTLAIYSHSNFERKPGRLQRHRVHLNYGDLQMPRPPDRREREPDEPVDSIFGASTPTTQPTDGGLFGGAAE